MKMIPRLVVFCALGFAACRIGPRIPDPSHQPSMDTMTQAEDAMSVGKFQLKAMSINAEYVFPDGEHVKGTYLSGPAIRKFKPQAIDPFYTEESAYYVCDTIAVQDFGSVYFIVSYTRNETEGWLVIYDHAMEVRDQIEVYYENAEGNFYLTSEIRDNIVTTTGENIVPEPEPVSAFRIDGLRWELIRGIEMTED